MDWSKAPWCIQINLSNNDKLCRFLNDGCKCSSFYRALNENIGKFVYYPNILTEKGFKRGYHTYSYDANLHNKYMQISDAEFDKFVCVDYKIEDRMLKKIPGKWVVRTTETNVNEICDFFNEGVSNKNAYIPNMSLHVYFHYPAFHSSSFQAGYHTSAHPKIGYEEIDISMFRDIVKDFKNRNNNMDSELKLGQDISRTNFKEIYDVACPAWTTKLQKYAERTPFAEKIYLTNLEINQMFDAATEEQRKVIIKYLKPVEDKNVYINKTSTILNSDHTLLRIEYKSSLLLEPSFTNKGFYLGNGFNWKIENDEVGGQFLVPTVK